MRLFQNCGLMPSYVARLNALAPSGSGFATRREIFIDDRFGALHFLKPVLENDTDAFLAGTYELRAVVTQGSTTARSQTRFVLTP